MKRTIILALALTALSATCFAGTSFHWYPSYKGFGQGQYSTNWLDMFQAFQADVCTNIGAIIDDGAIPASKLGANAFAATGTVMSAGDGLTGGGNLAANRTLTVGAGYGISVAADAVAVNTGQVATLVHLAAATNGAMTDVAARFVGKAGGVMGAALQASVISSTTDVDGVASTLTMKGADAAAGGGVLIRSGNPTTPSTTPEAVTIQGGVSSGGSYTGQVVITCLPTPTAASQAVPKSYVDGMSGGGIIGGVISNTVQVVASASITGTNATYGTGGPLTIGGGASLEANGGAMTVRGGDSTAVGGIATLRGGDGGQAGGSVTIRPGYGGTGTGTVTITGLPKPTAADQAASKAYVDGPRGQMTVTNDVNEGDRAYVILDEGSVVLSNGGNDNVSARLMPSSTSGGLGVLNAATGGLMAVAVGPPSQSYHAATKSYVDGATNAVLGNNSDSAYIRALQGGYAAQGAIAIGSRYINEFVLYSRAQASGTYSVAIGDIAIADKYKAISLGGYALGVSSLAGPGATAVGSNSVSLCNVAGAYGNRSASFGGSAYGYGSFATGDGWASGDYSFACADGHNPRIYQTNSAGWHIYADGHVTNTSLNHGGGASFASSYGYAGGQWTFAAAGTGPEARPFICETLASNDNSVAIGYGAQALGFGSIALGPVVVTTPKAVGVAYLQVASNMVSKLDMGGYSISNLATCTEATEAASKGYVDSRTNTWVTGSAIPAGQYAGQFALSNGASAVFLYVWTGSTWLPAQAGQ